jgi:hypothetical protein
MTLTVQAFATALPCEKLNDAAIPSSDYITLFTIRKYNNKSFQCQSVVEKHYYGHKGRCCKVMIASADERPT